MADSIAKVIAARDNAMIVFEFLNICADKVGKLEPGHVPSLATTTNHKQHWVIMKELLTEHLCPLMSSIMELTPPSERQDPAPACRLEPGSANAFTIDNKRSTMAKQFISESNNFFLTISKDELTETAQADRIKKIAGKISIDPSKLNEINRKKNPTATTALSTTDHNFDTYRYVVETLLFEKNP